MSIAWFSAVGEEGGCSHLCIGSFTQGTPLTRTVGMVEGVRGNGGEATGHILRSSFTHLDSRQRLRYRNHTKSCFSGQYNAVLRNMDSEEGKPRSRPGGGGY